MHQRPLGKTGMDVSEIGFGSWGIGGGWGTRDDDEALRALHRAVDLGVTFIDTAFMYGEGRSERLIGEVVRALRNRAGRDQGPAGQLRRCCRRSA